MWISISTIVFCFHVVGDGGGYHLEFYGGDGHFHL